MSRGGSGGWSAGLIGKLQLGYPEVAGSKPAPDIFKYNHVLLWEIYMNEEEIKKLLEDWASSGANREVSFATWIGSKD